jgi:hypothetical protein
MICGHRMTPAWICIAKMRTDMAKKKAPEAPEVVVVEIESVEAERAALTNAAYALATRINLVFDPEASTFNVCDDAPELDREINREVRKIETINDVDGFVANFWRAVASDPDATLKGLKNRVDAGSSVVNRGERQAPVAVAHVLSVDARTVQFVRLDTGEIIDSRDATAAEKQLELAMVRR